MNLLITQKPRPQRLLGEKSRASRKLLGYLSKFREDHVAHIGYYRKMYHTIRMALEDQHIHRFL